MFLFTLLLWTPYAASAETDNWPSLPDGIQAACNNGKGKSYFFSGSQYWRWENDAKRVDSGYPKNISAGWEGIPNNIDAAVNGGKGKFYFFKDSEYWRWDIDSDTMDSGYPKSISSRWPGVPDGIDGARFYEGELDHIVFYKGAQSWNWNVTYNEMYQGQAASPINEYDDIPSDIDAALDTGTPGNVSFTVFKGVKYHNFPTN